LGIAADVRPADGVGARVRTERAREIALGAIFREGMRDHRHERDGSGVQGADFLRAMVEGRWAVREQDRSRAYLGRRDAGEHRLAPQGARLGSVADAA